MKKNTSAETCCIELLRKKKRELKRFIKEDPYIESVVTDYKKGTLFSKNVAFVSLTNGSFRAEVFSGSDYSLFGAFDEAFKKAEAFVKSHNISAKWVKVDFVNSSKIVSYKKFIDDVKDSREYFFKKGVSFDVDFNAALLEAQFNCYGLFSYKSYSFDLTSLRMFFRHKGVDSFTAIPDSFIEFTTVGYISDEKMCLYKLYPDEENYGRRIINRLTADDIESVIRKSSVYLSNAIYDDGKFDYGVNPINDNHFVNYNILRHTGTIWSIIMQYDTTKDEALLPKIDSALSYMMDCIEQPDDKHAYLIEKKADEIKLGGNAVAIITLSTYKQVMNSDKYDGLIEKIANSILDCQESDGSYYHVLSYPDYSRKERDRIVYYDGEATFALARAYSVTGNDKYLKAAKKALDFFIANDYIRFCDHWIAYAVNEVTMYDPDEKYLNFGLRNANENLSRIFNQDTTFHTFLELLMAAFELYERIKENNLKPSYLQKFNHEAFIRTIYRRAHYMLNGFLYPEMAMYMKNPDSCEGTFCVRHDSYRIRIDDVQHYIGGYYNFYKHFDKLEQYYNEIINEPVVRKTEIVADDERKSFVSWILNNI